MNRIEQTTVQQTANRLEIQDGSAFLRKRAEAYRFDMRPRASVAVMIAADAFSLTLAWIVCMMLFQLTGRPSPLGVVVRCLITLPLTLVIFGRTGLYPAFDLERTEEVKRVIMCLTGAQAGCVVAFRLLHASGGLAPAIALGCLSMVLVPIGRLLIRGVMSKKQRWIQSVMLINGGVPPKDLAESFVLCPQRGLYPTAVAVETDRALVAAAGVAKVGRPEAARTFDRFINSEVNRKLLPPFFVRWKRLVDVPVALTAGVILLPVIATIVAAVKLTSPGKIFYGHPRVGRNNTPIRVWKFRTMVKDADVLLAERLAADRSLQSEWEQNHKLRNDPRLTPIGNFLRRYSLDELPQLWNVIKGDMSIVGPRPIIKAEIPKYAEYFLDYMKVLPGITGLWQVSGRNETTYQQRVHLDAYYVNNLSPLLDLYIMLRTVKAVISGRGAY
jgi:lipopolysaccharide/colanic/teichoic acid biosynthesis glycosyltransferase